MKANTKQSWVAACALPVILCAATSVQAQKSASAKGKSAEEVSQPAFLSAEPKARRAALDASLGMVTGCPKS